MTQTPGDKMTDGETESENSVTANRGTSGAAVAGAAFTGTSRYSV